MEPGNGWSKLMVHNACIPEELAHWILLGWGLCVLVPYSGGEAKVEDSQNVQVDT